MSHRGDGSRSNRWGTYADEVSNKDVPERNRNSQSEGRDEESRFEDIAKWRNDRATKTVPQGGTEPGK